jgi:hypothetical protein
VGPTGPAGPICGTSTGVITNQAGACNGDPTHLSYIIGDSFNVFGVSTNLHNHALNTQGGQVSTGGGTITAGTGVINGGSGTIGGCGLGIVGQGVIGQTLDGEVAWSPFPIVLSNGANNDVGVSLSTFLLLSAGGASATITGFDITSWTAVGIANGMTAIAYNQTGSNVTFVENSGSSLAGNRLTMAGGADKVVANKHTATFVYDAGTTHWLEIAP